MIVDLTRNGSAHADQAVAMEYR